MTIKHNFIVIGISVLIAVAIPLCFWIKHRHDFEYKAIHVGSGWGYEITMNGKLVIHQEYVPAVPGKQEFNNEQQAEATARLVIDKIKNNKFPTLSKAEVEQICAKYN